MPWPQPEPEPLSLGERVFAVSYVALALLPGAIWLLGLSR